MLPDNILLFNDKITMACSIENRVPFLDNDLIQFIEQLPANYKISQGVTKKLLRQVAKRHLPVEITKRKKRGFKTPFSIWLNDTSNTDFLDLIKSANSFSSIYFNSTYVEDLLKKYQAGHSSNFKKLYALFSLEMWYLNFYKKF